MLKLALRVFAETVFVGPSFRDLAQLVASFAPLIGISVILGAITGLICPRRTKWSYAVSGIVGLLVYHVPLWWDADPDLWQWRDPITSEAYQFAPAVLFCTVPALVATLIVRRVLSWHRAKDI
jgi:hypothetical protein